MKTKKGIAWILACRMVRNWAFLNFGWVVGYLAGCKILKGNTPFILMGLAGLAAAIWIWDWKELRP